MTQPSWTQQTLDLRVDGVDLHISTIQAAGPAPVVFLHGFGSTKEEYADFANYPGLAGSGFLAYDAPGFGGSTASDYSVVSIPFLVDAALAILDATHIDQFHVVGHSMGGLTALLLADRVPQRVLSFTDIEGNLAPEDCFLSRQIATHPANDPASFLTQFAARSRRSVEFSSALYGSRVLTTVDPHVVRPVFESMVALSDSGTLLDTFTGLSMPRMFMHGQQNAHLSYLTSLRRSGVNIAEIEHSGHWPMYSNPPAMWAALADFLALHEEQSDA
ncbi:alpha/beta fold hydrolase [Nocardioides sp. CFH 31398]|uniref:alpha/beta fold hydrolase n=1 Tax=Nocardioides sp. CFH 31398 TaxID=2919579 RepID=UPI001F05E047|nr:alpha/beta hydrolase [Nocardioides sp. CFH 31398]MCH1865302.1 alpha/beta hydrolase [Nocardioides sp. CFH 31398]